MPFQVLPCTLSDGPALACNNIAAFWTDPTWILMWPGKTCKYVTSQATLRIAHNLLSNREKWRHLKAVDIATGDVAGYARWVLPEDDPDGKVWSAALGPVASETERETAKRESKSADWEYDHGLDDRDEIMVGLKQSLMEGKRYLLLDYLAVHPSYRNQGVGSLLVESGVKEAEKMGMDSFILGMQAGLNVYKRAGFVVLKELHQDIPEAGEHGHRASYYLERKCEVKG